VGFDFVMPGGVTKLILKLTALHSTCLCAKDFAVDDIQIRPLGPQVFVAFDNEPSTTINKSVCFQHSKTISMSGTMGAYYTNPELQWQQSTDNGITWVDIAGATAATYSRSFAVPDTFLFRLSGGDASTISNSNCRVVSNFIKVEVDGLPKNYTITSNSPVCSGQDLKFKAEGAATYEWSGPNSFYDNIAQPHIFFSSLKDSGVYYVEVYSLGGCHVKDSTHVTIIGTDVNAGPDSGICKGRSVNLYASKGISYTWSPAEGLSNTTIINPVAKPDSTTVYTVKVIDKDGCSDTAQVKIIILNKNETRALFSSNDFLCRSVDSVYFTNESTGDIKTWLWNFGNGQVSTVQNPPVQQYQILSNNNNFKVQLVVMDTTGCADTAYRNLKVADNCYIAVPNAFTPNNDGLNDYLYPLNAYKAINLLFSVYNRLGQLVFKTNDWTKKWDGRIGGVEQEPGVYVWMLIYEDDARKKISLKGTTVLIR
jgi:gliding motility-associated-like protein